MAVGVYILDGHLPVPCTDMQVWGEFMQAGNRHVAKDVLFNHVRVSTVFLGLDHSFGGSRPLLFETMIFKGPHDQYQRRYSTWEEAERGHIVALFLAKDGGGMTKQEIWQEVKCSAKESFFGFFQPVTDLWHFLWRKK